MLPIVIVGGGIAGLVCARVLHAAGRRVLVLEREAELGGRARTRTVDGYTIDRGFQVLFTAYPTLGAALGIDDPGARGGADGDGPHAAGTAATRADGSDGDDLALRRFEPAARVVGARHASYVGDALRAPGHDPLGALRMLAATATARALPMRDKLRMLALRRLATSLAVDDCFEARYDDLTAREFLAQHGFTDRTVARFFAPFYGGILLDPTLATSAALLLFTFKMLAEGDAAVPAAGMGALARQLAAGLPRDAVRTRVQVTGVTVGEPLPETLRPGAPSTRFLGGPRRATGVVLADGHQIAAAAVVLATPLPVTERLAGGAGVSINAPDEFLGATTLYFAATTPPLPGRAIWLNAAGHERNHDQPESNDPWPALSHAVTLTEVAPEYAAADAPHGRHLLAASAVGAAAALDDDVLTARVLAELAGMRRAAGLGPMPGGLMPVAVERVPYAQYRQPPGMRRHRVPALTPLPGLWCAGEGAHSSSLEGAARGGRAAALKVLAAR